MIHFKPKLIRPVIILLCSIAAGIALVPVHGMTLLNWWRIRKSGEVVWQGSTRGKRVAITFDDGPDPLYTARALAILRRHGVKATFFLEGKNVLEHPELVRQIVLEGHAIGNHTFSHPHLKLKNRIAVGKEIA